MLTLKPNDIRPAYENQGDFDHPHKNKFNRSLQPKNVFRSAHENQVNFDPHAKKPS